MSLSLTDLPVALFGVATAVGLGIVIRWRPKLGLAAWLIVLAFVPIWMGVTVKLYFMPVTLVGIVALLAVVPRFVGRSEPIRLGVPDLIVAALLISCLAPTLTGGSTRATVFVVVTNWLIPFLVGRLFPALVGVDWIYTAVAIVFALVAVGLLVEYLTHFNPFVSLLPRGNDLYTTWGTIQTRGEHSRAEWAFGHSIAAGSAVAVAMPLTIAARLPAWLRMPMVLVMGAGVVVTISRVSMIGAGLGVVIMAVLARHLATKIRIAIIVGVVVLVAALGPFVSSTLADAGSEAANSASYRGWLVSLLPQIAPLGFSPAGVRGSDGELYFGGFQSIDSELIYLGLLYGWFALVIGVIGLLVVIGTVLARKATPATVAIAAQIPALATVAFITQYTDFFWFALGLAVFTQVASRSVSRRVIEPRSVDHEAEESPEIISSHGLSAPLTRVDWPLVRSVGIGDRQAVGGYRK